MSCPKCKDEETDVVDTVNRDDGGIDELCRCGVCGYEWTVINPGDRRLKAAVDKLKKWQSEAHNIQFTDCACNKKALMLSYQLAHDREKERQSIKGVKKENCGYWCFHCGWGNAGARDAQ